MMYYEIIETVNGREKLRYATHDYDNAIEHSKMYRGAEIREYRLPDEREFEELTEEEQAVVLNDYKTICA